MRILYITQYFIPEACAPPNRAYANVKYLSEKGHKVVILTEMPNHPKGVIFDTYRRKIFCHEKMDGFDVLRVWVYATPNKNLITRLLFYISFMVLGFIYAVINWKQYDTVYVTSPPLFVGVIGLLLKHIFPKTKFVFEVRDLWPDAAVALNELNNKKFIKLSQKLEYKCYTLANKIVAVTKYFKDEIVKKGITSTKIDVVCNGTDIDSWEKSYNKKFVDILGYKDKFIVIYAGNLGVAQGLETLIYAANEVKNQKDILFLFVGDGPIKKQLEQLKNSLKLNNVIFLPAVPSKEICKYLSIANCGIVPLKKSEVFLGTIPSKIFDYLSCELPILLGVDGEARKILEKSKGGLFFEPENHNDLIKNIIYLKDNPDIRKNMGKAGRKFVEKYYNRKILAKKIEKIILES
jgi:glycosyltransferase involved in cell wall biosynthesis